MTKIAYLILCHRNPYGVAAQAEALISHGDSVVIHYDRNAPEAEYRRLASRLSGRERIRFALRTACGWGEWSLVRASLEMLRTARRAFPDCDRLVLISGDCFPTKSGARIRRFFDEDPRDHIEVADFHGSGWIKIGIREERLTYRHFVNERKHKALFYSLLAAQRALGLKRATPEGLTMRIGSQWWALRASTVDAIFAFLRRRRDVERFFRTVWIPDEVFFQTLVAHVTPMREICSAPVTCFQFTDYGVPVVFHDDHFELLKAERKLFARKIADTRPEARQRLLELFRGEDEERDASAERVSSLYTYLAGRGRDGRRAPQRFWERSSTLDDGKTVLIVVCKKWHVGKYFAQEAARISGVRSFGYLFDEDRPLDVDLGGFGATRAKRGRHRRAFLRILHEVTGEDTILFCVDPSRDDVIRDFAETEASLRVLLIETEFSDGEYLAHAERVGLLSGDAGAFERKEVLGALRVELNEEALRLRRLGVVSLQRVNAGQSRVDRALALNRFLRTGRDEIEALTRQLDPVI